MQLISTVYKDFVLELVIFILYYFKTIFSAIKINPIRLGKILAWPLIVYKIWSIYLFIFWVTPLKIYNLILFDAKMRVFGFVSTPQQNRFYCDHVGSSHFNKEQHKTELW